MHLPKHIPAVAPLHRYATSTKRISLLLFLLLFTAFLANSQPPAVRPPQHHPHREKLDYQGFTIRVIPEDENNYRFTITKDGKRIIQYEADEHSSQALTTPEQALAGARWMIEQYQKTGHMPHRLPPPVLMEAKRNPVSKPKQPANK